MTVINYAKPNCGAMRLLALIDYELEEATRRFDRFHSPHEGWAVIRESLTSCGINVKANSGRDAAMVEAVQMRRWRAIRLRIWATAT